MSKSGRHVTLTINKTAAVYFNDKTEKNREALAKCAMPFAIGYSIKMCKARNLAYCNYDTVEGDALFGLAKAIDSWAPHRGIFTSWVITKIHSAVLDGMRELDHLTRNHRKLVKNQEVQEERFERPLSLDLPKSEANDTTLIDYITDSFPDVLALEYAEQKMLADLIIPILQELKKVRPRNHAALSTYFLYGSTIQIGIDLGVDSSRVSQLRAEAIILIQKALKGEPILPPDKRGRPKRKVS